MYRYIINDLIGWKNSPSRMPLILRGARQVGKTWIMKEFGRQEYKNLAYISFDNNPRMNELFKNDFDIARIIGTIGIETGVKITPQDTLIVFDEIQENSLAITSLKYFCEQAPEYHIIAAGSLLGVAYHEGTGFPVGKVEYLDLHPMSFQEFLLALDETKLLELLQNNDFQMMKIFKDKLINLLRQYCYVGGMPKVLSSFVKNRDFRLVRKLQKNILADYEGDFSKHIPPEQVERTRLLWNAIPSQLVKENKKCVYGRIKAGARAKDFEIALNWLIDSGLVHKVTRVTEPKMPLKAYEDVVAYKLFLLDVGLLGAMTDLDARSIIENDKLFNEFNGAITEQYVLQELKILADLPVFYWTSNRAELDFVIQMLNEVIPVEAKATINLQAKSLKSFREKFSPNFSIRFSLADYEENQGLLNIPLYDVGNVRKIMENVLF